MKKQFLILFAFISVLALSQVPQRFNKVIVTGDIISPKFIKTGSTADSVLLGNGSARAISTIKTDTVSLSNRINAKATGNGTANGTNTGDETLTSIKTKLGAATSVSDGYLKYQDYALLHTPTTVTVANGLSISGQNISLENATPFHSGALTFNDWNTFNSKEPAFTKNTGFNKNFGTTTGTVLEGRTFGTAANSAVGDFQPIENQRLSTTNSPSFNTITSTVATGTAPLTVNSTTTVGNLGAERATKLQVNRIGTNSMTQELESGIYRNENGNGGNYSYSGVLNVASDVAWQLTTEPYAEGNRIIWRTGLNGVFGSWKDIYHSGNLTNTLTTNYIPKWNGSSFVNSLVSDLAGNITVNLDAVDGRGLYVYSAGANNDPYIKIGRSGGLTDVFNIGLRGSTGNDAMLSLFGQSGSSTGMHIMGNGDVKILTTTPSTSPTNGALVVNGGVGADHVRANNFYGNGSNLTGVQLPITLTTNGTSGAATFSGNVLNVPNYDVSGGVNQTQTTVNGSTSGTMVCSMPFRTGAYKKVIIEVKNLNGDASYTYPTAFTAVSNPDAYSYIQRLTGSYTGVSTGKTAFSITGGNNASGWIIIEGY